jgi:hypothetical protein
MEMGHRADRLIARTIDRGVLEDLCGEFGGCQADMLAVVHGSLLLVGMVRTR